MLKSKKKKLTHALSVLPIPDKLYFNIGEVSDLCSIKAYVLRYWEQEFPQLKPLKRRGNRRFYQRQDIILIRQIKTLLYEEGFTIEGARLKLANIPEIVSPKPLAKKNPDLIEKIIADLESVLQNLQLETSLSH